MQGWIGPLSGQHENEHFVYEGPMTLIWTFVPGNVRTGDFRLDDFQGHADACIIGLLQFTFDSVPRF